MLKTSDFDYHVPHELIAQEPLKDRAAARLLVLDRDTGDTTHTVFSRIGEFLRPGDLLVLNDTKVLPFRLTGERSASGGKIEVLLVEPVEKSAHPLRWLAMTRSGGKLRVGDKLELQGGASAVVVERRGEDGDVVDINLPERYRDDVYGYLDDCGITPLPPYIERGRRGEETPDDREYYQTVYARVPGAVAAPTAGMHFTNELLGRLHEQGVATTYITLHVGPGTFRPVKGEDIASHHMHSEVYAISEEAADKVNRTRAAGGRIVAVGTTVVRTLEAAVSEDGFLRAGSGRTDIFIYPPFDFRLTDALITNFHLPKSTLLMLVSAFAGRERILSVYAEAVKERYRFFSYGDAMLIM
jgi:S-adenosylmethionine:tRNA ribosyltransferase-isomerase